MNLSVKGVGKPDQSLTGVNSWSSTAVHGYNYSDKINGMVPLLCPAEHLVHDFVL